MEMERRKAGGSVEYELAVVKSAAWAWYQRGSASEGRRPPVSEYDLTMSTRRGARKLTRYKLEAMRTAQEAMEEEEGSQSPNTPSLFPSPSLCSDCNSDLLDTYEIERISRQLDYCIEASSNHEYNSGFFGGDHRREVSSPPEDKKKSKGTKGLWLKVGVGCGSRDDVVEFARGFRNGRLPEKLVRVVCGANFRRRTTMLSEFGHATSAAAAAAAYYIWLRRNCVFIIVFSFWVRVLCKIVVNCITDLSLFGLLPAHFTM